MEQLINKLYNFFNNRNNAPLNYRKPLDETKRIEIKDDIINLSIEIKSVYPHFSSELFRLKDNLYVNKYNGYHNGYIYHFNHDTFFVVFTILKSLKYDIDSGNDLGFWVYIHHDIKNISQKLFIDGHYPEAVQNAFVQINSRLKQICLGINGIELDGPDLMRKAFRVENPLLKFNDLQTKSEKDVQEGYSHILAGSIMGIRNPKAHENLEINKEDAVRKLMLASLLMHKIDEAVEFTEIQKQENRS